MNSSQAEIGSLLQASPVEPNAVKFERFMFDMFPRADRTLVIEADRDQNFLPLKDARSTETSPEAVRRKLSRLHSDWLRQCNIDIAPDAAVEISPLVATSASELAGRIASSNWS